MARRIKHLIMLRRILVIVFVICLPIVLISCGNNSTPVETSLFALDTYITMTSYGSSSEKALEQASNTITYFEKLWSVTDENSEIYQINHANGEPISISDETFNIIDFSLDISKKTNQALDITLYPILTAWGFTTDDYNIPSDTQIKTLLTHTGVDKVRLENSSITLDKGTNIDLGAVGKGYIGDKVIETLKDNGIQSALLNLGGNVQTLGSKPDGSSWSIGIRNPFDEGNFATIEVVDKAVITSGGYERYFVGQDNNVYWHILDGKTGKPAKSGLISATIVGNEGKLCDALSTATFVMGLDKSIDFWKEYHNFDMILVTENGEIYITNGIESSFSLNQEFYNMKVNVIN